jgi:UDPglucose--hexose-1-phosphate uridylyltransferase
VIAPGRARRPGAAGRSIPPQTPEEREACPFCEGRENRTPPETLALGRSDGGPDTPGWQVRVVPNLYPALERQEVVVHAPRHARSVAELTAGELRAVATAWSERASAARSEEFAYVQAVVNEGRDAGASRAHSHSQLAWLREPPPAVAAEDALSRDGCRLCTLVRDELRDAVRVVAERDSLVLLAAYAGRLPYELLIAPVAHTAGTAFESNELPAALTLFGDAVRRLHAVEGAVPLNAWLHDGAHWHIEVVPRLSVLAGLELGAGIYVNTVVPEDAAAALREAEPAY